MYFKAVFSYWVDWSNEVFDDASLEEIKASKEIRKEFLVEADNEEAAESYANRFQGLETNASEGLDELISISFATAEEIERLQNLSIYEDVLRLSSKR